MYTLPRRDRIILTAVDIISELGIQGLTTKEIASRQEISEGTIFRHFKSKNEIILEVLKNFSQYDKDIVESIKIKDLDFDGAIKYYTNYYAEHYQNYPEIASILYSYDYLLKEEELANYISNVTNKRWEFLYSLVERGKERGEIPLDVDGEDLVFIIEGTFNAIIYRWRLSKYTFPLKDKMDQVIGIILSKL